MTGMIDVHSHVVPLEVFPEYPRNDGIPWVRLEEDGALVSLGHGPARRHVPSTSWDLAERIVWMDDNGVDQQVISSMPMLMAYTAAASDAATVATAVNEWIAEAVAAYPARLRGFGTVPMQDPDLAVGMLETFGDHGLHGVQIGTNVAGVPTTEARFDPIWEAAARLRLPVLLHPVNPLGGERFPAGELASHAGFPVEVGAAATALITSGILARLPELRVCATHGGGSLWASVARLEHFYARRTSVREKLIEPPVQSASRLYVDCLTFSPRLVEFHCATAGATTMMIGSDAPFINEAPGWTVDAARLSAIEAAAIRRGTASRFLGLGAPQ